MLEDLPSKKKQLWQKLEKSLPVRGLSEHQELLRLLRGSAEYLPISPIKKAQILERMLERLPERKPLPFFQLFLRRASAGSMLFAVMMAAFVPLLPLPSNVALAAVSELSVLEGEAFLNGELVSGVLPLTVGDEIRTGEGGVSELRLFDDSLVVMAPNTRLELWTLTDASLSPGDTRVHLKMDSGEISAHVLNLTPEARFLVESSKASYELRQRGSFDLTLGEWGNEELVVMRNRVYREINGERETVRADLFAAQDSFQEFSELRRQEHLQFLAQRYEKEEEILPGSVLYALQQFQVGMLSRISVPGIRENHLMAQAENQLNEARYFMREGNENKTQKALNDYKDTALLLEDSGELTMLAQMTDTQKQLLVDELITEDESQLMAAVTEATLIVAPPIEEGQILLNAASQQLAKIVTLMEAGNMDSVPAELDVYRAAVDSFISEISSLTLEERNILLTSALEGNQSDYDQLIEMSASDEVYRQLGMILMSTQEDQLHHLPELFEGKDEAAQQEIYESVKELTPLTRELEQHLQVVEGSLKEGLEIAGVSHSNEAQNQAQASE